MHAHEPTTQDTGPDPVIVPLVTNAGVQKEKPGEQSGALAELRTRLASGWRMRLTGLP
jgi:hypothetical protein